MLGPVALKEKVKYIKPNILCSRTVLQATTSHDEVTEAYLHISVPRLNKTRLFALHSFEFDNNQLQYFRCENPSYSSSCFGHFSHITLKCKKRRRKRLLFVIII